METLNLHYHKKRLITIAIERFKTCDEVAKALGIARRTLYEYRKKYKLL